MSFSNSPTTTLTGANRELSIVQRSFIRWAKHNALLVSPIMFTSLLIMIKNIHYMLNHDVGQVFYVLHLPTTVLHCATFYHSLGIIIGAMVSVLENSADQLTRIILLSSTLHNLNSLALAKDVVVVAFNLLVYLGIKTNIHNSFDLILMVLLCANMLAIVNYWWQDIKYFYSVRERYE